MHKGFGLANVQDSRVLFALTRVHVTVQSFGLISVRVSVGALSVSASCMSSSVSVQRHSGTAQSRNTGGPASEQEVISVDFIACTRWQFLNELSVVFLLITLEFCPNRSLAGLRVRSAEPHISLANNAKDMLLSLTFFFY